MPSTFHELEHVNDDLNLKEVVYVSLWMIFSLTLVNNFVDKIINKS